MDATTAESVPNSDDEKETVVDVEDGYIMVGSTEKHELDNVANNNTIKMDQPDSLHIRDQGYAWVVVGAMFATNIITSGYVKAFGILTNAIMDTFPGSSGTMAGVLVGLLSGCRNILTPLTGSLSNRIGLRLSICMGAFLFSISLIISAYCTSITQLSITLGIMIGFSQCLIEVSQVVVVSQYFSKKLSLANGIRVSSYPLGGVVFPMLLTFLIEYYGLRLTFFILAGITCQIFLFAALMRPIGVHVRVKAKEMVYKIMDKNGHYEEEDDTLTQIIIKKQIAVVDLHQNDSKKDFKIYLDLMIQKLKNFLISPKYLINSTKKIDLYNEILKQNEFYSQEKPKNKMELKYFKKINYLPFLILGALIPMACPLALYYTILNAKNIGLSSSDITILLAFQSMFDFALRLLLGYLNDKKIYKLSTGFAVCLFIAAFGIGLLPLGTSLIPLTCFISLYSFGPASYQTFLNVILCEKFGKEHVSSTWGFVRTMHGIFSFIHSTGIGYLVDVTGSYTIPYFVMSAGLFLCGVSMGVETLLSCRCFKSRRHLPTIQAPSVV